ncbi:hypothetical protein D3C87_1737360 [compost metagenome]
MPVTAVDLGTDLARGIVHDPLVVTPPLNFLAFITTHQTARVPGGLMPAIDLTHHEGAVDVIIQESDHDLFP